MRKDGIGRTAAEVEAFMAGRTGKSRVMLRALTAADQDEFVRLTRDSAGLHRPWMSLPATPADFQAYLGRFDHDTAQGLLVCLADTGAIAGTVFLNSIIRGRYQNASLAYAAFSPTAGQGYLSEGVGLVLGYAFGRLRLHRLDAQIQPGNQASLALVRRLGFRYEGHSPDLLFIDGAWQDHESWAITNTMYGPGPWPPHPTLPAR
ncbi:acetyltransferase [Sphaerisporangium rufum]|uniref:Acetyltransferase n=1 Tax=Sphaerisporangium rufum TaxID=1381558 RepID=A0A919V2K0_9ACTN|nr:GNAT family N-acetyltransferase [Sphaerisporangium rufum]GII79048.1 acetyltransferase [Sphaerisporangium rufum]